MNIKKIFLSLLAVVCVLSCLTLPALAAEPSSDVPPFPEVFTNQGYTLVNIDGQGTWLILYDKDLVNVRYLVYQSYSFYNFEMDYTLKDTTLKGPKINQLFKLNESGDSWVVSGYQTAHGAATMLTHDFQTTKGFDAYTFYYSTVAIEDSNGGNFFPLTLLPTPLWVEVLTATEANKNLLNQNKTLLTLTLCGVGLIALLIGLSLFGKVLKRFQVK